MKKVIMPAIAILFFATACEKSVMTLPGSPATETNNINSSSRKWVDFNYTIHKDPTSGEYSCPTPKSDCSKISPDPTGLIAIDEAIENENVQAFFNADSWADNFPYLNDQPTIVEGLQNGNYTMVRKTNSSGEILYIVISPSDNPEAFNAIYATLVRNEN